ncbi:MAG TPA: NAD-dependent epimerase/dehydratase family protein [Candidatus Paceibacterota bacterium]
MKIIVTGGAGFIASHIVDAYIKAGHRVAVIDDLSKGFRRNVNPKAKFYKADITDLAAMEKIFKKERPEMVNHHASIAEVSRSMRDPIPTLTVNVLGTANVLMAFGHHGRGGARRKFIFASTGGAMYGDPKHLPVDERTPIDPLSPYGLSKKLAEDTIVFYAKQFGFDHFIFRYANVFGPRQNPHGEAGIVAIFGELMKAGKTPTIFGDGTKARDYVYVSDVAAANLAALRRGKNTTVNIGRGKIITDREMFDAIAEAMEFEGKPKYAAYRKGEIYRISLDAAKARRILGWKPKVEFKKGVREATKGI